MALDLINDFGEQEAIKQAVERCPFLRNIAKPTVFTFSSLQLPSLGNGARGPIFEDGPIFESMFRLFHGCDGVVPLSGQSSGLKPTGSELESSTTTENHFNPLVASAASISLSFGGAAGPFSFDFFKNVKKARNQKPKNEQSSESQSQRHPHESGIDWLATGNCPTAKAYRAIGGVLPLVAKVFQPPASIKYKCPPAIIAARKALAAAPAVRALRPQTVPVKVLAIGALGMMLNIPLGMVREHTLKFSPAWFLAVHATVPFVAMLRKAVVMPRYAMAYTIASAILGQVIGSRAERARIARLSEAKHAAIGEVLLAKNLNYTEQGCRKDLWVAGPVTSTLLGTDAPVQASVAVF